MFIIYTCSNQSIDETIKVIFFYRYDKYYESMGIIQVTGDNGGQ